MSQGKKEEELKMNATMNFERPCTISESIQQSCQEVKLMREGKIPKRSWQEFRQRMKEEITKEEWWMQFEVIPTKKFEEDVRYYLKKKKFKHILDDVEEVVKKLEKGKLIGDAVSGLSFDENVTVKVRIANTDTRAGKSNGYRLIYYAVKNDCEIYLLTIYYKKDDKGYKPTARDTEGKVWGRGRELPLPEKILI